MDWSLIALNATVLLFALMLGGYLLTQKGNAHEGYGALAWLCAVAAVIQTTSVSDWVNNWMYIALGLVLCIISGTIRTALEFKKINPNQKLKELFRLSSDHIAYKYLFEGMPRTAFLDGYRRNPLDAEEYLAERANQAVHMLLSNTAKAYKDRETDFVTFRVNPEVNSFLRKDYFLDKNIPLYLTEVNVDAIVGSCIMQGLATPFSVLNVTFGRVLRYIIIDVLYTRYLQGIQKIAQNWFKDLFKF